MDNNAPANQYPQRVSTESLDSIFANSLVTPNPVNLVDIVIKESVNLKASDILFEPQENGLLVRIRIDGVLHELGSLSIELYDQIVSRIKVMASLDVTEKRKIQEGQIIYDASGKTVNLRVEIVKTIHGELAVIRIHEKETIVMPLSGLGFNQNAFDIYNGMLNTKTGLLLVCGPTGCGKTTTLYSTLTKLNENHMFNVLTIEDPVEYQLEGVNQMQVQKDIGFTFAQGLKTILRLSPDIILVGEIRDKETAEIAVESGLTGQLVLSTIHAEDTVGGLFRMLDLGIETYLLNSSLNGIVAQRLVRRNCSSCSSPYQPTEDEVELFKKVVGRAPGNLVSGKGCPACQNLGFKGRIGIFEVLQMNSDVKSMLRDKINETEIREKILKKGFTTLLKDGFEKAEQGLTTISEVLRNSVRAV